ncbi:MAG: POTRA domain-containing protein, partial [Halocynthiibacter sp.]
MLFTALLVAVPAGSLSASGLSSGKVTIGGLDGGQTVSNIVVRGNHKTRAETILQELTFAVGDVVNESSIAASQQAVM